MQKLAGEPIVLAIAPPRLHGQADGVELGIRPRTLEDALERAEIVDRGALLGARLPRSLQLQSMLLLGEHCGGPFFEVRAAVRGAFRVLGEEECAEEHLGRVHVRLARLEPLLGLIFGLLLGCLICSTRCTCMVSWGLRHLKTGERRGVSSGVASYLSRGTFCEAPRVAAPPPCAPEAAQKSAMLLVFGSVCCKFGMRRARDWARDHTGGAQ